LRQVAIDKLSRQYPAPSWPLNRELSQLLVALGAPDVVQKTLDLRDKATTQEEQLHYEVALRLATNGWTPGDRQRYFAWFQSPPDGGEAAIPSRAHPSDFNRWFADVGERPRNGSSYNNFIKNLRKAASSGLNETDRIELASLISDIPAGNSVPKKERKFVREWKTADLLPDLDLAAKGRNFARGREAYVAAQCAACHRLGDEGGAVGPDLTAVSSRFTRRDILESTLEPSKVVSEQFQNTTLTLKDGDDVTGRILEENDTRIVLVPNQLTGEKVEVKKGNVQGRVASKLSPMPANLVDILTRDELLDLLAYLESGGRKEHAAFQSPASGKP
jgi:putative heme-binding domain-containing protein